MKKIIYIGVLCVALLHASYASATCYTINYSTKLGDKDNYLSNNVTLLQSFLREFSYLAPGPSGYFGPQTFAAVKSFQASNNVRPISGFVGPLTRAKINTVSCNTDIYNPNTNPSYNQPTGNSNTTQYQQNALSTHTLYVGENVIYRYKIKAPDNTSAIISSQIFPYTQNGVQTSNLTLQYSFDDYFGSSLLGSVQVADISLRDTNYISKNIQFNFPSNLTIPAGRTVYFRVVQQISSRNYGASVVISHPQLGLERLSSEGSDTANASLRVTSLNSGETVVKGSSYPIRWSSNQIGNDKTIKISLIHPNGTAYDISNVYGSGSGYGEYQWTIPDTIEARSGYRIRITSGNVYDVSDMTFTIQDVTPTITVTSPVSGDVWNLDSTTAKNITWTYTGMDASRTATAYLLFPDGTQCTIGSTVLEKKILSGTLRSTSCIGVTKTITPGAYKIGIGSTAPSGASIVDYTDSSFTITTNAFDPARMVVISPNGGENPAVTQNAVITWTTPSSITSTDYVSIQLDVYTNGGTTPYKTFAIASNIQNTKTYTWNIPTTLNGVAYVADDKYKVTIITQKNTALQDSSDTYFNINPLQRIITVTSPTQTSIARDTDITVSWNKTGFLNADKLTVAITPVGSSAHTTLKSNILVNDGSTIIRIPITTALNSYRITLIPISYTFGANSSPASPLFALTNKSGYSITPGSIASTVYKGDTITTSWSSAGLTNANLSVRLVTSAGSPIAGVSAVSVAASAGQKDILVPATLPTGSYKISYTGISDGATVTAYSNTFTVTDPLYGFTLVVPSSITKNTNATIAWNGSRLRSADPVQILIKDSVGGVVSKNTTFGSASVSIPIPSSFTTGSAIVYATTTASGYVRNPIGAQQSTTIVNQILPSITVQTPSANSTSTGSINATWINNNFSSAVSTVTSIRVSVIQKKGTTTKISVIQSGLPASATSLFIPVASNGALGTLRNVGIDLAFEYQVKVEAIAGTSVVATGVTDGTFRIQK